MDWLHIIVNEYMDNLNGFLFYSFFFHFNSRLIICPMNPNVQHKHKHSGFSQAGIGSNIASICQHMRVYIV